MEDTGSSLGGDDTGGPVALNIVEPNLAFHDISYTIPTGILCKGSANVILDSASGILYPGVNAIMGPTGSGKTTLLDILANRKASSRVTGTVMFNGKYIDPNFRFKTGYVVQDDIVSVSLTVRENLNFSAALRLPSKTTNKQRSARVEKVIAELGLLKCADQKIGSEFVRGVSGGERRRCNIGMELIIEPQILFLDEPTTGLDAHTAVSVLQQIKNLTLNGDRVVVLSIHQPRFSIFKLFDTLTLLSCGKIIYHGSGPDTLGYFNQLGFKCEEHDNPADFFLDLIDSCEKKVEVHVEEEDKDSQYYGEHLLEKEGSSSELVPRVDLAEKFLESKQYAKTHTTLSDILKVVQAPTNDAGCCTSPYATSFFWQLTVVSIRSALNLWRNPITEIMLIIVMIVYALVIGAIFFERPDTPRGMQDRLGAMFFIIMSQVFGALTYIEMFITERAAFLHETSSGYYRVLVYLVAKVAIDMIARRIISLTIYACVAYFMIGFQAVAAKFFLFYLTLGLTIIAGASISFAMSALVGVYSVAHSLVNLVFVIYMLCGGTLIGLASLPVWVRWIKFLSVFRYSVEALAVNELKDQTYAEVVPLVNGTLNTDFCLFNVETDFDTNITYCTADGNQFLRFQGYRPEWPWYADQLGLFLTGLLWLVITYFILRLTKKYYEHYK